MSSEHATTDHWSSWHQWSLEAQTLAGDAFDLDSAYDAWVVGTSTNRYAASVSPAPVGSPIRKHRGLIAVLLVAIAIVVVIKLAVHSARAMAGLPQIPLVDGSVYLTAFLGLMAFFAWIDATA